MIQEIINRFKEYASARYSSQQEAADALNISRSHFNKIINGRDYPSTALLIRMENIMRKENEEKRM